MRNFLFAALVCCAVSFPLFAQENEVNEETKESKVEAEAPAEDAAEAEEEENKLAFERKPYFNATVFGGVSAGINIKDGDVNKEESYEIGLDNLILDFKGEFGLTHRALYNPDFENGKLISDGVDKAGSAYTSWGLFAMPYATLWDVDLMARVSYFKAPFYEANIASKDDSNLGVNIAVIYNFCDYAGIELDYDFNKSTFHGYEKNETVSESLNTHSIALALSGAFDFLWEEKEENK